MDVHWDEWLNRDNPTLFQPELLSHRGSGMLYGCAQQLSTYSADLHARERASDG